VRKEKARHGPLSHHADNRISPVKISGKVAVVTGAASGIGRALAERFVREGARGVALADIQQGPLEEAASSVGGLAVTCDATQESDVRRLIERTEQQFGPIDIFVSNAGVFRRGDENTPDPVWDLAWHLHVMAHVYAARELMPKMVARGSGYFIVTSSAAGLLSHLDSASYAVTKHAAVAFAEYLAIRYGDQGVAISVLCPQQVRTAMTTDLADSVSSVAGRIEPEALADCVVECMDAERFLMLPHPAVLEYLRRKTADYDRWLAGMRRLKGRFS
jgi:NAD(P)-dependent dehydrogenase (short-subunit alcohol dehydrogenase family)